MKAWNFLIIWLYFWWRGDHLPLSIAQSNRSGEQRVHYYKLDPGQVSSRRSSSGCARASLHAPRLVSSCNWRTQWRTLEPDVHTIDRGNIDKQTLVRAVKWGECWLPSIEFGIPTSYTSVLLSVIAFLQATWVRVMPHPEPPSVQTSYSICSKL
jgi:hypothetical protein